MKAVSIGDNLHKMSIPIFWEKKYLICHVLSFISSLQRAKWKQITTQAVSCKKDLSVHARAGLACTAVQTDQGIFMRHSSK